MPWKDKNEWRLHRDPAKHALHSKRHRESHPEVDRRYRQRTRLRAMEALGNCCCKCGFDDWRALEIDHVHNGGCLDRKKRSRHSMYMSIINGTSHGEFQLLCANCHQIKSYEEVWKHLRGCRKAA